MHIISKVDSSGNEGDTIAEEIYGLEHTVNDLEWLYIRAMARQGVTIFFLRLFYSVYFFTYIVIGQNDCKVNEADNLDYHDKPSCLRNNESNSTNSPAWKCHLIN